LVTVMVNVTGSLSATVVRLTVFTSCTSADRPLTLTPDASFAGAGSN
jgi:hypothetical protein